MKKLISDLIKKTCENFDVIIDNQDIIIPVIEEQIIRNYYYSEGVYQHHLKNDQAILEAVKLLQNNNKYSQILSGK